MYNIFFLWKELLFSFFFKPDFCVGDPERDKQNGHDDDDDDEVGENIFILLRKKFHRLPIIFLWYCSNVVLMWLTVGWCKAVWNFFLSFYSYLFPIRYRFVSKIYIFSFGGSSMMTMVITVDVWYECQWWCQMSKSFFFRLWMMIIIQNIILCRSESAASLFSACCAQFHSMKKKRLEGE